MARLWTSGAESQHYFSEGLSSTSSASPYLTYDTSTVRFAGTRASYKFDSTATPSTAFAHLSFTSANGTYYYFRGYFKRSSTTNQSAVPIAAFRNTGGVLQLDVRYSAAYPTQLRLYNNNTASFIGSPAPSLDTNWHRLELGIMVSGTGAADSYAAFWLDGVLIASSATETYAVTALGGLRFGWYNAPTASEQIWFDDCALNDSTGTNQTSTPGVGTVWLLAPASDNARGTNWFNDNAGTTNLYAALDNTPPQGVAHNPASMPATAEIYNIVSGTGQNSDYNGQTYTALGIPATDTIMLVQMVASAGSNGTAARSCNAWIVSNPAETQPAAFTSVSGTAAATYPTGWTNTYRTLIYSPTVTRGTAPVIRVQKNVNNIASIDFCLAVIIVESQQPTVSLSVQCNAVGSLSVTLSISGGSIALTAECDAVGALSATVALSTALVAEADAVGNLSATLSTTGGGVALSGECDAVGSLSATASLATALTGEADAVGTLSATVALSTAFTDILAAVGVLSATLTTSNSVALAVTINAVGSLAATASLRTALGSTISGVGSFAPTISASLSLPTETIAAVGSLSATTSLAAALSRTISGVGTLSATLSTTTNVALSVTISAVVSLSATSTLSTVLSASIPAVGSLSATLSTTAPVALSVTISASGALSATGTFKLALPVTTLAGIGAFSASLAASVILTTTISGAGTLTGTPALATSLTALLSENGNLAATFTIVILAAIPFVAVLTTQAQLLGPTSTVGGGGWVVRALAPTVMLLTQRMAKLSGVESNVAMLTAKRM